MPTPITFQIALDKILKSEGGYVNDPNDPGGETNLGISKRAYPNVDIAALTPETVAPLYKRDYWDKIDGDNLPSPLNYVALDCAVNQGVGEAAILMRASSNAGALLRLRLARYRQSSNWGKYGAGWAARLVDVASFALDSVVTTTVV
jgi:lysozyme family protein